MSLVTDTSDKVQKHRRRDLKLEATTLSRGYLGSIVASMGEALLVVSRAGLIHTANPAVERMLGYEAGQLLDRPFKSIVANVAEALQIKTADAPLRLITRLLHKDGFEIPVSISAVPMSSAVTPSPPCGRGLG